MTDQAALLAKEITALVQRLRTWSPTRWSASAEVWGSRADLGRHLAQRLADTAADLTGEPRRLLPVLATDLLVADQLAVTGDDLLRCGPPDDVCQDAVAHVLLHRYDLLGELPPDSLGGEAALVRGRAACTPR